MRPLPAFGRVEFRCKVMVALICEYLAAVEEMHKKEMCHTVELQQHVAYVKDDSCRLYGEMSGSYGRVDNQRMTA